MNLYNFRKNNLFRNKLKIFLFALIKLKNINVQTVIKVRNVYLQQFYAHLHPIKTSPCNLHFVNFKMYSVRIFNLS